MKGESKMRNKEEKLLLLYLLKNPTLKEIDIYKLSKNIFKLKSEKVNSKK